MKIVFTKHAAEKIKEEVFIPALKITKTLIEKIIIKPEIKVQQQEKTMVVSKLDADYSLVIIYKKVKRVILVITFWPSKKGRYEIKILQRG